MDLKELRCEDVDRIHLTQNRDEWWAVMKTVEIGLTSGSIKDREILD
jgi:hypothetical protein